MHNASLLFFTPLFRLFSLSKFYFCTKQQYCVHKEKVFLSFKILNSTHIFIFLFFKREKGVFHDRANNKLKCAGAVHVKRLFNLLLFTSNKKVYFSKNFLSYQNSRNDCSKLILYHFLIKM